MSDPMREAMPYLALLDIEIVTNTAEEVRLQVWRGATNCAPRSGSCTAAPS